MQSYKTFRSEIGEHFHNLGLGKDFLFMTLKKPYTKQIDTLIRFHIN